MTFGQRLKQLREENGLSQIALANQLGITEENINEFENDGSMPSADILVKLSSFYNMSVDTLLCNTQKTELPIAKAQIVNSKKQIKQALKYESAVSRTVLYSVEIGILLFFGLALVLQYIQNLTLEGLGLVLLIYAIPFFVISLIFELRIILKAKKYSKIMQGKSGFAEFYNHYLNVYYDGQQAPVSYSYSAFKKTRESDGYFLFYMPDSNILCFDKRQSEGYIESVTQILSINKNHKNKSALSVPNEKSSIKKLLLLKNISNMLFTLSFFSLHLSLIIMGCFAVAKSPLMKFSFFIAGIIPLCGLVYGIYTKIRKFRGKKLIITSSIFLCFTLLYGSLFALMPIDNMNSGVTANQTFYGIVEDLQLKDFEIEQQATIDDYSAMERYYKAESPDSEYTINLYEFSDANSCNAFYSQIGDDLQYHMYSKRTYNVGNVKMLSIATESEYCYKYTNGEIIVSVKADVNKKDEINEILDSLDLVY